MKKLLILLCMLAFDTITNGQSESEQKYISVTGSAEIVLQPDEIELEIVLKEYGDRDIEPKVELDKIEEKFFTILSRNKISRDKILLNNMGYDWYYWWHYRDEYHKRKHYTVKISTDTDLMRLMKELDFEGVESLRIGNRTNHKMQELRKEVKIQAIKAAKDKAEYLLESIGNELGDVISVEELAGYGSEYFYRDYNVMSNVSINNNSSGDEIENIASITLRYEIKAKFEIK
jgi:uncharacterized protein